MMNKWMIVILALLVVITGGIGYYSFTLNQQVDRLSERITLYKDEQESNLKAVSSELGAMLNVTKKQITTLEGEVAGTISDINTLNTDLSSVSDRITGTEEIVSAVTSQVTTLDKRVADAEANVSGLTDSILNASGVYEKAVQATVRITDGETLYGSGFIYDTEGRVLTAYHVISEIPDIYIMMYDGGTSHATITGYCQFSDIAVLQMENNPSIEPLPLVDSSQVRVGEPVIAIGSPGDNDNPLGLRDTLTSGIISQVNRYVNVDGRYIANLVQFDTAVNFGNSGGPLINSRGQVVGVITARIDPSIGDGIYWAVSSSKTKRVVEEIITSGSYAYPLIGTGIADLTPEMVAHQLLETSNGILVTSVVSGSAAQDAGIRTGDIIISMNGIPMRNIADLTSYLGENVSPGDTIIIGVIRNSNKLELSVVVGARS